MAFPTNPTDQQTYQNNGVTYLYNAGLGVWDVQGIVSTASPVSSVAGRTGAVILTASDVSLGNVTNESKATMFASPTFTGTATMATVSAGALTATSLTTSGALSGASLSVTAGLQNIAIGSTTASTGAFTTLSASGAVSFSTTLAVTGATTLSSTLQTTSLGVGTAPSGTSGEGRFTNAITAYYSDERLKTKISTIENALDKIDQLTGFLYVENDLARSLGFNNPNVQTALSAQAVKLVQPEVVKPAPFDIAQREDGSEYSKSGEDYLTIDYEKLIPLLVEGIKELRREINQLKGQ